MKYLITLAIICLTLSVKAQTLPAMDTISGRYACRTYVDNALALKANSATINSGISRPVNSTNFTISTTRTAIVFYNISISCTASIGSASAGSVALQWYNSATSTWITSGTVSNSNTVTLAITLNSVNIQSAILCGVIPSGALCRMVSTSSGTTVITYLSGNEYY